MLMATNWKTSVLPMTSAGHTQTKIRDNCTKVLVYYYMYIDWLLVLLLAVECVKVKKEDLCTGAICFRHLHITTSNCCFHMVYDMCHFSNFISIFSNLLFFPNYFYFFQIIFIFFQFIFILAKLFLLLPNYFYFSPKTVGFLPKIKIFSQKIRSIFQNNFIFAKKSAWFLPKIILFLPKKSAWFLLKIILFLLKNLPDFWQKVLYFCKKIRLIFALPPKKNRVCQKICLISAVLNIARRNT